VLLAVAQSDMIDRHVQVLQAAGLKPEAIDVEPLAVSRTLLDLGGATHPAGHTVVIVNAGAGVTDIGIYRDKLPTLLRALPLAGDNITRAIADTLGCDLATAEQHKRDHAEVLLDQIAQPTADFGGSGGFGAGSGFVDFTAAPAPQPGAPSGGSGRMPFDFSSPGDAPPPAPAANPFDVAGGAQAPGSLSGSLDPSMAPGGSEAEPGFFNPQFPAPSANLPVPSGSGGGADALRLQIFSAIAPVLSELAGELRRSLDFHRAKAIDAEVHEILLVGGTARLRNLAPYLEHELGIPTRVADPLHSVSVSAKNFSPAHVAELSPALGICVGLGAYNLTGAPGKPRKAKRK
jgi:type IV pilus assembly protein PilM